MRGLNPGEGRLIKTGEVRIRFSLTVPSEARRRGKETILICLLNWDYVVGVYVAQQRENSR